jgi:hypothetical protein
LIRRLHSNSPQQRSLNTLTITISTRHQTDNVSIRNLESPPVDISFSPLGLLNSPKPAASKASSLTHVTMDHRPQAWGRVRLPHSTNNAEQALLLCVAFNLTLFLFFY